MDFPEITILGTGNTVISSKPGNTAIIPSKRGFIQFADTRTDTDVTSASTNTMNHCQIVEVNANVPVVITTNDISTHFSRHSNIQCHGNEAELAAAIAGGYGIAHVVLL